MPSRTSRSTLENPARQPLVKSPRHAACQAAACSQGKVIIGLPSVLQTRRHAPTCQCINHTKHQTIGQTPNRSRIQRRQVAKDAAAAPHRPLQRKEGRGGGLQHRAEAPQAPWGTDRTSCKPILLSCGSTVHHHVCRRNRTLPRGGHVPVTPWIFSLGTPKNGPFDSRKEPTFSTGFLGYMTTPNLCLQLCSCHSW